MERAFHPAVDLSSTLDRGLAGMNRISMRGERHLRNGPVFAFARPAICGARTIQQAIRRLYWDFVR